MPDKIWLHKDTKYSTADEVFGYQYEFAQEIECEGIENFVEYVPADAFIEKACDWLRKGGSDWYLTFEFGEDDINFVKLAEDFKTYMKGE